MLLITVVAQFYVIHKKNKQLDYYNLKIHRLTDCLQQWMEKSDEVRQAVDMSKQRIEKLSQAYMGKCNEVRRLKFNLAASRRLHKSLAERYRREHIRGYQSNNKPIKIRIQRGKFRTIKKQTYSAGK